MEQLQFEFSSLRYVLEKEHRRRLQDAVEEIKTRAYESLALETKDAIKSAADFRRQLEESSRGVQNILQRYNELQDKHKSMKMDYEIAVRDSRLQAKRAVSMKRSVMEAQAQVRQLNEQLEKDEEEAKAAIEMRKKMTELEAQLQHEREQKDLFKQQRDALIRDRNRGGRSTLQLRSLNGTSETDTALNGLQDNASSTEDKAMQNVLSIWNANFSPTVADVRMQAIRQIAETPISKTRRRGNQESSGRLPAVRPSTSSFISRPPSSSSQFDLSVRPSTVGTAIQRPRAWAEMDRSELEMNVQAPYAKRKSTPAQYGTQSRHGVASEVRMGQRTLPRFFVPF
jgi:myosin heavy subunit